MTGPKRIQLRRSKGWRKPEGAIVVARPSKWGNPWRVTRCHRVECGHASGCCVVAPGGEHLRVEHRDDALHSVVASFAESVDHPNMRAEIQGALHGHDLACWCPLDQPCHADVLLELANHPPAPEGQPRP
ncbi:MAG TPA: DUF4326 domain-containing protein [Jatrophihabitantaceae bacterium]|jgi:hypothetical protein